jgi:hypothetical protein
LFFSALNIAIIGETESMKKEQRTIPVLHIVIALSIFFVSLFFIGTFSVLSQASSMGQVSVENIGPSFLGDPVFTTTTGGAEAYVSGEISGLISGSTTTIYIEGIAEDLNGQSDIVSASMVFYRDDVGDSCVPDNNNCYRLESCVIDNDEINLLHKRYSCEIALSSWIDATDSTAGIDSGRYWKLLVEIEDTEGTSAQNANRQLEIQALTGLYFDSAIDFGAMTAGSSTTSETNTESVFVQQGNVAQNIRVSIDPSGFVCPDSDVNIPPENLRWSTADVGYGVSDTAVSTSAVDINLGVSKRLDESTAPQKSFFWNLFVPEGVEGRCTGAINILATNAS